jgi:hypothetical protein
MMSLLLLHDVQHQRGRSHPDGATGMGAGKEINWHREAGGVIRAYRKRMRSLIHNRKLQVHLPALFNGAILTELLPHEVTQPAQRL